ncbi:hypothetical protein KC356_g1 [Hortaea werneckii]|nr:hypothetical protein KC356_g1 [Hortaea werneckii]
MIGETNATQTGLQNSMAQASWNSEPGWALSTLSRMHRMRSRLSGVAPSYYFSRTETETRLRRSPAPGHSEHITKNDLALVQMSPSPVSRPPTSCASKHTKESYMKTKMEINNVKDAVYGERIIGSRLAALRPFKCRCRKYKKNSQ